MANLYIDGQNLGFHGFMVQLRDEHGRCLPGVEVGEIGPKINAGLTNIGYARFTNVRLPRFNMFARAQQVTPEGKYIKPASKAVSKFKYISMMNIRVDFVWASFSELAKASTIAVRYSCVRKQGYTDNDKPDGGERKILDYQMQQYRCFKALALSHMYYWNQRYIRDYLQRVQKGMMEGDESAADALPELHATLSGFKVFATVSTQHNIEELRKSCGGQGFLRSCGLADMAPNFNEMVTAEGEQVILSQQLSRFLVKEIRRARSGAKLAGMAAYLAEKPLAPLRLKSYENSAELMLGVFKHRSRKQAEKLEAAFTRAEKTEQTFEWTLNQCAVLAWKAAEGHSMYAFALNNFTALKDYVKDPAVNAVLMRLFELMALQHVRENGTEFVDILDETQFDLILERITVLLSELRPDAVALVDGFGFQDEALSSTLGRRDGNVYEAIYDEAKKSPLNKSDVMLGWEDFSKILDLDILRQGVKEQRAGVSVCFLSQSSRPWFGSDRFGSLLKTGQSFYARGREIDVSLFSMSALARIR